MTGFPTFLVELDDGTGTFPYDITAYVETQHGGSITAGRGDEHGDITPSVLSMALNNTDGRFSLGSTSGGYGAINLDRRIRWTETVGANTYVRFTGYVQDWPVEWPGGGESYAIARVTAVDRLARMARRKFRSMVEHEYRADSPLLLYLMDEASGAVNAGDTSGNDGPELIPTIGSSATPAELGGTLVDGLGAVTFDVDARSMQSAATFAAGAPASLWIECFFLAAEGTDSSLVGISPSGGPFSITASVNTGTLSAVVTGGVTLPTMSGSYTEGQATHFAVKATHGVGAELYIDGVLVDSEANGAFSTATWTDLWILGLGKPFPAGELTVSHLALGTASITAARLLEHATAPTLPGIQESSDDRITRFASYANIDPADLSLDAGILTAMPSRLGLTGVSAAEAMQQVAQSEGGLIFIDGEGSLVFQNRNHRRSQATGAATFVAADLGPDLRPVSDLAQVRNDVTGTRPAGINQRAFNQASLDAHEQYPDSIELQVTTDADVRNRIDWIAGVYAEPQPRIPGLTVDLLSQTQAKQQAALGLQISDRVDLVGLPTQAPDTGPQIIEGWVESWSHQSWSITFNTSPWEFERTWILGDATYGLLGDTTRLGY